MHSAFNLFVFPNSMFTPLLLFCFVFKIFLWKGYELSGEIALKNNHYYYYYYLNTCLFLHAHRASFFKNEDILT